MPYGIGGSYGGIGGGTAPAPAVSASAAVSVSLLDLKRQVAGDIQRSDAIAYIPDGIEAAIRHYEKERFWFLEGRATIDTVPDDPFIGLPSDAAVMDVLLITIGGSRTPMTRVDYREIDEKDDGVANSGMPTEWAYYQDNIRLWPVPDIAYPLTLSYHKTLASLSDSDGNAWITNGFDIIRYRAGAEALALVKDPRAAVLRELELQAYGAIRRMNTIRSTTGRIKKTVW